MGSISEVLGRTRGRSAYLASIALFACVNVALAGANRWTTHGPGGGLVWWVVISPTIPSTAYGLTSDSRLYRSTNSGDSWMPIGSDIGNVGLHYLDLLVDPAVPTSLYAITYGNVFTSTDLGDHWSLTAFPAKIASLAISRSNHKTIYAGTEGGTFKTNDGGQNWYSTRLLNRTLQLVVDPTDPLTVYAETNKPEYGNLVGWRKSIDGGQTWSRLPEIDGHRGGLVIDPRSPKTLYLSEDYCFLDCGGGVWKSTDGGVSWLFSDLNTGIRSIAIDPGNSATLYAVADNHSRGYGMQGVLKSTDAGRNWVQLNAGLPSEAVSYAVGIAIDPNASASLLLSTGCGVFRSLDGARSWESADSGFANGRVSDLAIDPSAPSTVYAATDSPSSVYKSTDNGLSWTATTLRLPVRSIAVDPVTPTTLYACLTDVYKSIDGGWTWSRVSQDPTRVLDLVIEPNVPNTLYGISDHSILKSSDGIKWTPTGGTLASGATALAMDPHNPSTLYVGTYNAGVAKSTDAGASWRSASQGLPEMLEVSALSVDPIVSTTIYVGSTISASCVPTVRCGIWKSVDAGDHWVRTADLPGNPRILALALDPREPTTIYTGTQGGGVFRSTDGGSTWSAFNTGLTNMSVATLAIDPTGTILQAGTRGGGVFEFEIASEISRPSVTPLVRETNPRPIEPRR